MKRNHLPHRNQAIPCFAVFHQAGTDITRVICTSEGHGFHAKHRKDLNLQTVLHSTFVVLVPLRLTKTQCLYNLNSYYPLEISLIKKNWTRQKLFSHQYQNYYEMKTDCYIKLVLISLEQNNKVSH